MGGFLSEADRPEITDQDRLAIYLYNLMGGLDWSAIPFIFSWHDIEDADGVLDRLVLINRQIKHGS